MQRSQYDDRAGHGTPRSSIRCRLAGQHRYQLGPPSLPSSCFDELDTELPTAIGMMRMVLTENPTGHVLYCGDGDMLGAASYLGGLMASWGWAFEYVDSDAELSPDKVNDDVSLIVFSDYPAGRLTSGCHGAIERIVIGGWSSF